MFENCNKFKYKPGVLLSNVNFAAVYNMVFAKNGLKVNFHPLFFPAQNCFFQNFKLNQFLQKSNLLEPAKLNFVQVLPFFANTEPLQVILKMDIELKSHIRKLTEKFNYKIEYRKDILVLQNEINKIELWQTDKYGINVSYNLSSDQDEVEKITVNDVYDVIITLLSRKEQKTKLVPKPGILLTIQEWIKEEGEFAREQLEDLKRDLIINEQIEHRDLGGNRFLAEYYDGLLILTDDLWWAKSNVIQLKQK